MSERAPKSQRESERAAINCAPGAPKPAACSGERRARLADNERLWQARLELVACHIILASGPQAPELAPSLLFSSSPPSAAAPQLWLSIIKLMDSHQRVILFWRDVRARSARAARPFGCSAEAQLGGCWPAGQTCSQLASRARIRLGPARAKIELAAASH